MIRETRLESQLIAHQKQLHWQQSVHLLALLSVCSQRANVSPVLTMSQSCRHHSRHHYIDVTNVLKTEHH